MIDFYGSGFDVAEKMGLIESLRARHYPMSHLTFVDDHGNPRAALDIDGFRKLLDYRHFNFMRGDLADVLYDAIKDRVPIKFATEIGQIRSEPERLRVEFTDGTSRPYDLLIGADGIHSHVRRLCWGEESEFSHFLGYYVACGIVDNFLDVSDSFLSHLEPKTQAAVYSIRGNRLATLFAFKSERLQLADREQRQAALAEVFQDQGWIVPQLMTATQQSPEFYFDEVAQIDLAPWHKDRVVLVGDACQCLTLLAGQGASMAMAGAYHLAEELRQADGDYTVAFPAYQDRLKPEIERRQEEAQKLAGTLVPDNRWSMWMMYLYLKVAFWPGFRSIFLRQIGARSIIK